MITENIKGKTVAITGCTGGLGNELCFRLSELGANLIMLDRNAEKSALLSKKILEMYPQTKIKRITVDLENFDSVKHTAELLLEETVDMFFQNAGAYSIPRKICSTGFDNVFQINFVSHYYITHKLLEKNVNLKVVAVGSIAHNYSKLDQNDLDFKTRKSSALVYGNSKRFLMFSLYKLFENNPENLSVVHPGITFTNITAHYPKLIFAIIKHPMKVLFMKPKKAVNCLLAGFESPTPKGFWIGPKVFDVWGNPQFKRLKSYNESEAEKIFFAAEKMYKDIL